MRKTIISILTILPLMLAAQTSEELKFAFGTDSVVVNNQTCDSLLTAEPLQIYASELDSLMHDCFINLAFSSDCEVDDTAGYVFFPDSVYVERLQKLPYIMEMPLSEEVKKFIEMYAKRRRQVAYMLGLGQSYYFEMFQQTLAKYNIPLELCYLPVIESALNARAISRAGAGGLWQFMVKTGHIYGLEVNSLVDERMDPVKSTDAAARYLKYMYSIYNDWHVVIAAYNCGPGNVQKAIRNSGGKTTFWEIYPYLPRETKGYVPIFIAACYIMNYYTEHNICPAKSKYIYSTDTVMISDRVHLRQIAEVIGMNYEELSFLNPQYKAGIIPGNIKPYPLTVPLAYINSYALNRDSILAYKPELSARIETVKPAGGGNSSVSGNKVYYKVRKGDNLASIAKKHRTTVKRLKQLNGLKSNTIRVGQRLRVR